MPMPTTLRYLQYAGFGFTEVFSFCLFVLILTRSGNKFGNYKYLMGTFTVFSMTYGVVEVLTQPIIHIEGTALIIFVDSFLRYEQTIGFHMASLYCSSYGVCVALLVTHFYYRYLAVCRPHVLQFLSGKLVTVMFLPAIAAGVFWFVTVEAFDHQTNSTSEYLKDSLKLYYGEDSYAVGQLSFVYYYYDESNTLIINWVQCISILILFSIMGSSVALIIFFANKTYKSVESHTRLSAITRDLHRQLFRTLVLQFLVPFFTMFLPVGLLFVLPIFNVHLGYMANTPSAWISFYPAIDAAIAMVMIKDFRRALFFRKRQSFATIGGNFNSFTPTNFRRQSSIIPG